MENFTMTKKEQKASDFGIDWFPNGSSRQIVYSVFDGNKLVATHISTKYDQDVFCIVVIMTNIIEYRFSTNPKKKFSWATKQIVVASN